MTAVTHTLHRRGNVESLSDDYVILVMSAKGINDKGSAEKLKRALEIAARHNAVNFGDMKNGNLFRVGSKVVFDGIRDTSIVHAVYTNKKDLCESLADLKEADLGMSVVVSGLFDEVSGCLETIGMKPHTVQFSLGTFGKQDLLPKEEILEITTMCGHHQVSPLLVQKLLNDVRRGKVSPEEAGRTLAKQCVCGVFNPVRATRLLCALMER